MPYSDLQKAVGIMNRLQDAKVMDDVGAAIAHLKSQSNVESGSIGVTGFCMGGRFTYLSAAHHTKDVKARWRLRRRHSHGQSESVVADRESTVRCIFSLAQRICHSDGSRGSDQN